MKIGPGEREWIAGKLLQIGIWIVTVLLFSFIAPFVSLSGATIPLNQWWDKMQGEGELVSIAAIILIDAFGKFIWAGFKKETPLSRAWALFLGMCCGFSAMLAMILYTAAKHESNAVLVAWIVYCLKWSLPAGLYATIWAGEEG
jgi:hypothetical protein